jgi:hypothetical protein
MKPEVRAMLGKAAYESHKRILPPNWLRYEELGAETQEVYQDVAESVVKRLAELLVPVLTILLTAEDIKRLLEGL